MLPVMLRPPATIALTVMLSLPTSRARALCE
jgi:hypothetical protein